MKSKTKYYIDDDTIKSIFDKAELGDVSNIVGLVAGEFNTAYFVTANNNQYVLKIAPKDNAQVLTYETDMMAKEVNFYKQISNNTNVKVPKIYYYDESKTILPSSYFIMEKLNSKPLTDCKITKNERREIKVKIGEMVAELHTIKGSGCGYEQNGLHNDWYQAIKSMVNNLIKDCKAVGKTAKIGTRLLKYIEKYKSILIAVSPVYTHFDIWDGNVFYQKIKGQTELTLIDTERGFWGDGIGDFTCIEPFTSFKKKQTIIAYNKKADKPIGFAREDIVRYNIMQAYLALIIYSEKFVRYNKSQIKYYLNIIMSLNLVNKSFKVLKGYNEG